MLEVAAEPGEMESRFWHPPVWKCIVVVVLIALSAYLFWLKQPAPTHSDKVEILPFIDSPPAWDGSFPCVVISPVAGSTPLKFRSSIEMIQPTVRHDSSWYQ